MENRVIGYIMKAGKYDYKYYFVGSHENMASFILENQKYEVIITDNCDCLLVKYKSLTIENYGIDDFYSLFEIFNYYKKNTRVMKKIRFVREGTAMIEI